MNEIVVLDKTKITINGSLQECEINNLFCFGRSDFEYNNLLPIVANIVEAYPTFFVKKLHFGLLIGVTTEDRIASSEIGLEPFPCRGDVDLDKNDIVYFAVLLKENMKQFVMHNDNIQYFKSQVHLSEISLILNGNIESYTSNYVITFNGNSKPTINKV